MTLHQSGEERLRVAIEVSSLGLYEFDAQSGKLRWDEKICEIWGLPPHESGTIEQIRAGVHPEDWPWVEKRFFDALSPEGDGKYFAEYRVVHLTSGQVRWVMATGKTFFEQGRAVRMIGTLKDVTEQKRTEAAYEESERRAQFFADAVQNSSQPFAAGTPDGRLLQFNPAFMALTGYTAEELMSGTTWSESLTPQEWRAHEREILERLNRTGEPVFYEKEYVRKDGTRVPIELKVHVVHEDDGRPAYYHSFVSDISERKRAESALRAGRQLLETVVSRMPAAVSLVSGDDFRVLLANAVYQNIAPGREIVGKAVSEIWPEVWAEVEPIFRRVIETGESYTVEDAPFMIRRHAEGPLEQAYFSWSLYRVPLPDGERYGLLNATWDTTKRKNVELSLEANQAVLRDAVRARDEFLSIASHELKTPLTTIQLQIQNQDRMLRRVLAGELPQEIVQKSSMLVSRQLARLTSLINDLLDVSRLSSGKLRLTCEWTNLSSLLAEIVERYRETISNAGMSLAVQIQPEVWIEVDRLRIEQVVGNLIVNATKYAAGRPLKISLQTAGMARIEVSDQGPGIKKEHLELIFDRFERSEQDRAGISGLGLGLYISRQIVRAHSGDLRVESEPGCGAKFIVELPLAEPPV